MQIISYGGRHIISTGAVLGSDLWEPRVNHDEKIILPRRHFGVN